VSKRPPADNEDPLTQATPEITPLRFNDITAKLAPFVPSWRKLRLFDNTVVEADVSIGPSGEVSEVVFLPDARLQADG